MVRIELTTDGLRIRGAKGCRFSDLQPGGIGDLQMNQRLDLFHEELTSSKVQRMTLREGLLQWAALRRGVVRPRTHAYHKEVINLVLRLWPEATDLNVNEINESDVVTFSKRVEKFSTSRWNSMVTVLRATVPSAKKLRRRRVQVKERPMLSQLELSKLLDELDRRPRSHAGLVVRFLAHTGLRINEARQLRWSDVLEDCIVAPGMITKSGRPRCIPFVNGIRETLMALRGIAPSDLVLPQLECKRSLRAACKIAGLPRLTHHDFRHLFATRCIQSGVDVPTVARWLGHQDGGALLGKVYFHLVDNHSRQMALKVEI